jgi:L-ascorbate metabolism protein UlaG (beta-lactamase superfamily)
MKLTKTVIILAFLLELPSISIAQKLEIQYLANEGLLIKSDSKQILIDATFNKEFEHLDVLPDTELDKIKNAESNYKSIDIILATHLHGDHFNAEITGSHLLVNKKTMFLGPKETVANFEENFNKFHMISSQIKSETPNFFESKTVTLNGIEIKMYRLEHSGESPWKEAENIAYLITLGEKKILHFGDSKIDVNIEKLGLINENIDVVILPFWELGNSENKKIILEYINPKKILAGHIPTKNYSKVEEYINSLGYKNVVALNKQLEIILIE